MKRQREATFGSLRAHFLTRDRHLYPLGISTGLFAILDIVLLILDQSPNTDGLKHRAEDFTANALCTRCSVGVTPLLVDKMTTPKPP